MTITVRPAEPHEYAEIGRITVAAYLADGQLEAGGDYAEHLADVAGRAELGDILAAVDDDGHLLGSVAFALWGSPLSELAAPGEAEFRMLAVDPAAQRRGVGEALARACVARAEEVGATAIMICTRDFAKGAQRMYERIGFVRVPERDWVPAPGVSLLALRLALASR